MTDQDNTNDSPRAIGMSAAERQVRGLLDEWKDFANHEVAGAITIGVLRTLMRDLDMWREITTNEIDKWSFDALVVMAKRILDTNYPVNVFLPKKVFTLGDDDDLSRVFFITAKNRNDGPVVVSLLREVIEQMEKRKP